MKRYVCALLAGAMLLSGCAPVIYNNDLSFTPYDPPDYWGAAEVLAEENVESRTLDYESYAIEGYDAFYFLPYHGNSPNDVYDFILLDYTSDGYFIYGYLAAYYGDAAYIDLGEDSAAGLSVEKAVGTAPDAVAWSDETLNATISATKVAEYNAEHNTEYEEGATDLVVTYMAFNPKTRDYNVFHTEVDTLSLITNNVDESISGLSDGSSFATIENGLVAQKLSGKEEYLFCFQNRGYVYDSVGELVFYADYMEMVTTELTSQGVSTASKAVELVDFVMDGSYVAYTSVTVSDDVDVDENTDLDDGSVDYYLLSGYYLPLADDPDKVGFVFTSDNLNNDAQVETFLALDGQKFASEEAYNAAIEANQEALDALPDQYEPYNSYNMVLVGLETVNLDKVAQITAYDIVNKAIAACYNGAVVTWAPNQWYPYGYNETDYNFRIGNYAGYASSYWHYFIFDYDRWDGISNYEQTHLWQWLYCNIVEAIFDDYWYLGYGYYNNWLSNYLDSNYSGFMSTVLQTYYAVNQSDYVRQILPDVAEYDYGITGMSFAPDTTSNKNNGYLFGLDIRYTDAEGIVSDATSKYQGLTLPDGLSGTHDDYFVQEVLTPGEQYKRILYYSETVECISIDGEGNEVSGYDNITHEVTQFMDTSPVTYVLDLQQDMLDDETITFSAMDYLTSADYALPASDLGVYYYGVNSSDDSDETETSHISYTDSTRTVRLSDTDILGTAMDAELYAELGEAETVAVLTDLGVQFYHRDSTSASYTEGAFVDLESFTPDSANVYTFQGDALTEDEASTYDGASSGFYDLAQISQLTSEEMLVATLTDGMVLYNVKSDLFVAVEPGGYFRSYAIDDPTGSGSSHMVVGFDSTDYYYENTDFVWAKCYEKELSAKADSAKDQILTSYLDSLYNLYHQYTHQVIKSDTGVYTVVSPDKGSAQEQIVTRAYNLFMSGTDVFNQELSAIAQELGQESISQDVVVYGAALRTQMQAQYAGMNRIYSLVGLTRDPTDGLHMQLEGQMLYEQYTDALEYNIVHLFLSQYAPADGEDDYDDFKDALIKYAEAVGVDPIGLQDDGTYDDTDYILLLTILGIDMTDSLDASYTTGIDYTLEDGTSFSSASYLGTTYVAISTLLQAQYQNWASASDPLSWDDFLTQMLFAISPYNALTTAQDAFELLCELTGLNTVTVSDVDAFYDQVAGLNSIYGLEEVIVDYAITLSKYVNTDYVSEYDLYKATEFTSSDAKEEAFLSSGFYEAIILEYRENYEETDYAADKTWDERLENILQAISGGIVTDSPTASALIESMTSSTS